MTRATEGSRPERFAVLVRAELIGDSAMAAACRWGARRGELGVEEVGGTEALMVGEPSGV
jgi:hypothetical protein